MPDDCPKQAVPPKKRKPREPWPVRCQYPGCGVEFMAASGLAKYCPECKKLKRAEWKKACYLAHKDEPEFKARAADYTRRYVKAYPERAKESNRKSKAKRQEQYNRYLREWRARNHERCLGYSRKSYARKRLLSLAAKNPANPILGMAALAHEMIDCPKMHARMRRTNCGTIDNCWLAKCQMIPAGARRPVVNFWTGAVV